MPKTAEIAFSQWSTTGPFAGFDTNRRVVGTNLVIDAIPAYPAVTSKVPHDLTASHFGTRFVSLPNLSNGSTEVQVTLSLNSTNAIGFGWSNNSLYTIKKIAGTTDNTYETYNATTDKYLRVRESGGTVYWERSATGATWSNIRAPLANPFTMTSLTIDIVSGNWNSAASPGAATIGAVNVYDTPVVSSNVRELVNGSWVARTQYKKIF